MLKTFLLDQKIDALLITQKENIGYLSNFWGSFAYLLISQKSVKLFTDARYLEEAKSLVKDDVKVLDYKKMSKYLENKKVGFEALNLTVSQLKNIKKLFPNTKFKPTENLIESLRISKDINEITKIKKAAQINDKILEKIKDFIKIGITEKEVQWKIRELAHKYGSDKMAFQSIVNFNKHTAHPHHEPNATKLQKGDLVLIDMGVKFERYCSDITRVFFTKTPTKKEKEIFEIVLKSQEKAIQEVSKTNNCKKIDQAARRHIEQNGYGDFFTHSLGHSVGLNIHESPSLSPLSKSKLQENSVFTIEPGIYLSNKFGIRLEDLFIYKEKKAIQLSRFTKDIEKLILTL